MSAIIKRDISQGEKFIKVSLIEWELLSIYRKILIPIIKRMILTSQPLKDDGT